MTPVRIVLCLSMFVPGTPSDRPDLLFSRGRQQVPLAVQYLSSSDTGWARVCRQGSCRKKWSLVQWPMVSALLITGSTHLGGLSLRWCSSPTSLGQLQGKGFLFPILSAWDSHFRVGQFSLYCEEILFSFLKTVEIGLLALRTLSGTPKSLCYLRT